MGLQDDLRSMISSASGLTGAPTAVILSASGATVEALPGFATVNDTVLGTGGEIAGNERTLRFVAADVPTLAAGQGVIWNDKAWKVKHLQSLASGALVKAFLQEAL